MDLPNLRVWCIECWCCLLRPASTLFFFTEFFVSFFFKPLNFCFTLFFQLCFQGFYSLSI